MSRIVKESKQELFNRLPQKTSTAGFYYEVVEEELSSPNSFAKQHSSMKETTGSTSQDSEILSKYSKIQRGVAVNVSELYEEINSRHYGPYHQMRTYRSGPIASMTDLNQESPQKVYRRAASQEEISDPAATEDRRFRSLVSLNPHVIEPEGVLERFFNLTEIDDEVYVVALIYLHRALDWEADLEVKHFHKLVSGCLLLAHKYVVDGQYWCLEDFGFIAGVTSKQMQRIEKCVLRRVLCYDLFISDEEYQGAMSRILAPQVF